MLEKKKIRKSFEKKFLLKKSWKLKMKNFEKKYLKRNWKIIKKKFENKKTLKNLKKGWKTRGFGQMVRLG